MTTLRCAATLVTSSIMVVGGVGLIATGPPLVFALGVATVAVGVFYALAGVAAERALRSCPQPGALLPNPARPATVNSTQPSPEGTADLTKSGGTSLNHTVVDDGSHH